MTDDNFHPSADTFPANKSRGMSPITATIAQRGFGEPFPVYSKGIVSPGHSTLPATDGALNILINQIYCDINSAVNRSTWQI